MDSANEAPKLVSYEDSLENCDNGSHGLWLRKQRMSKRDVAFGLNTSVGLGAYLGIMGSRRDVITAMWKTGLEGVWPKERQCDVHKENPYSPFLISGRDVAAFLTDCSSDFGNCSLVKPMDDNQQLFSFVAEIVENQCSLIGSYLYVFESAKSQRYPRCSCGLGFKACNRRRLAVGWD